MKQTWWHYLSTVFHGIRQPPRFPSGHYYSPIPSAEDISRHQSQSSRELEKAELGGIELHTNEQLQLLEEFKRYYSELPFSEEPKPTLRYHYDNGVYCHADGVFLFSMIRSLEPKRIVEIGSGLSSALMLDTNEHFFNNTIDCTFIDPSLARLKRFLRPTDFAACRLVESRVQEIPLETFSNLQANDILFVDSSHVSKLGSDVNYILFEILPRLAKGVHIHFHDIFFPFEYPDVWLDEGIAWNEAYLLRAFLSYNSNFQITLFSTFLQEKYPELFAEHFPICAKNRGASLWIKKTS